MKTGLIISNTYQNHNTGDGHPEKIHRVTVIIENLKKLNDNWSGLLGLDLASQVSCKKPYKWNSLKTWNKEQGYKKNCDVLYRRHPM